LAGVFTPGTGSVAPFPVAGSRPLDFFASSLDSLRVSTPNGLPVYGQPSLTPPTPACVPGIWQTISNCTTFQPGTYFVTGNATGTAVSLRASAASVRLFFTCRGSGGTSGVVAQDCTTGSKPSFTGTSIGGGRTITVSAPGGSGLALVFDKGLTGTQGLVGAGRLAINGDVYGPDATLSNSGTNTTIVTGHVVIGSVSFNPASPNSTTLQVALPPPQPVPDGPVRLVGTG
jgi:hypothetical protein